ncbi:MAG TPA: dihydrolipoamide acetyltransferase family protein [Candidatus Sulfotelmatobacter sp.]|jgi:pyruvate dehydrogenase E2 component (dihydrolipoamide acetyltransferase)|nr:dihydrolipoamide acetyltransferase family protein [Candidatus Sulfotelmatobacter sp.]
MAFSVVMPALEMAQETGKLIAWRKKEGDRVTKGEPLLEIETDKAVMEVEAPADGILAGITGSVGSDIPVGQTIAWIVAPGEKPPTDEVAVTAPAARGKTESHTAPIAATPHEPSIVQSARISPKARRLAKELGVDITSLRGSGPGGEILSSDVQAASAVPSASSANIASVKSASLEVPSTLGRLMAERTTQSWTSVPHFFVTREIEASALNQYREKLVAEIERLHDVRITHTDLLVALASRVLLKHPRLNSSWTAEGIRLHAHVNMGVAVAVNDGVVAAVIPNSHSATLAEIATQRRDVAERARAGKLRPADIADATFTISNLGMYKVDRFTAIITPPQAAILAVGAITERVVAVEGKPAVRPMMTLTLSCDHRVADGARAAMFLTDVVEAVLDPQKLLSSISSQNELESL